MQLFIAFYIELKYIPWHPPGGNKSRHSASARWKQKRAAAAAGGSAEPDTAAEDKQNMERLTGLADRLLSQGNMEVYQMTREAVNHQVSGRWWKNAWGLYVNGAPKIYRWTWVIQTNYSDVRTCVII